ncbi:uncharacterized protein LOC110844412 isoform X3 [Folsomia candida]|nr:uncharacterized protein LOC110844412 isoform X3 [Folsomia candida]
MVQYKKSINKLKSQNSKFFANSTSDKQQWNSQTRSNNQIHLVFQVASLSGGVLLVICHQILHHGKHDLEFGTNSFLRHDEQLRRELTATHVINKDSFTNLETSIKIWLWTGIIAPFIIVGAVTWVGGDPPNYVVHFVFSAIPQTMNILLTLVNENTILLKFLVFWARYFLGVFVIMECLRTGMLMVLFGVIGGGESAVSMKLVKLVSDRLIQRGRQLVGEHLRHYRRLQIVNYILFDFISTLAFLGIFFCALGYTATLNAVVHLHAHLPPSVTIFMSYLTLMLFSVLVCGLYFTAGYNQNSKDVLRTFTFYVAQLGRNSIRRKFMLKQIASLRQESMHVGLNGYNIFTISKFAVIIILRIVIEQSVNIVMLLR